MKTCSRCVMPSSWSGIQFSEDGVCSLCHAYDERAKTDWAVKERAFRAFIEPMVKYARNNKSPYDCIVGFSGGKDSSWVLYRAVTHYGLKPLAVTFDHGFHHDEVSGWNIREIPKQLNVDHVTMNIGDRLRNHMIRVGLDKVKDFCIHCHRGVGAFTARMAAFYDTPLVLWGEPAGTDVAENTSGYAHFQKWFDCGLGNLESAVGDGVTLRDLHQLQYPVKGISTDVYLGNYEPWSQAEHADILERELGWKRIKRHGSPVDWDKADCYVEPLRFWQGKLKGQADHMAFPLSKLIREGRITRDEALEIAERTYDGKPTTLLGYFWGETGISPDEFERGCEGNRNTLPA